MKALELVVYNRLMRAVGQSLPPNQFAFRPGLSTELHLVDSLTAIGSGLKRGEHCLVTSLDIAGAYDAVRFDALIDSLVDINAPPAIVRFLKTWLYGRRFRCRVKAGATVRPTDRACVCGLPQGGVLSPLLWALFLSDFSNSLGPERAAAARILARLFADDIVLLEFGPTRAAVAANHRATVLGVAQYLGVKGLGLSDDKSRCM